MNQGRKYQLWRVWVAGIAIVILIMTLVLLYFREKETQQYNAVWRGVVYESNKVTHKKVMRFTIYPEQWKK